MRARTPVVRPTWAHLGDPFFSIFFSDLACPLAKINDPWVKKAQRSGLCKTVLKKAPCFVIHSFLEIFTFRW